MPFAIAAAIPVVEKIIETIFKPNDTKAKAKANEAVKGEKDQSSAALKSVSDELATISLLLEQCLPAEDAIVTIKGVLDGTGTEELTHSDLSVINRSWHTLLQNLSRINKLKVDNISDVYTQRIFLNVIDQDTDGVTQTIKDSADPDQRTRATAQRSLAQDMKALHDALVEVNKVGGTVIGEIANELSKLSVAQKGDKAAPTTSRG